MLVGKWLIYSKIQEILGANGAEDYQENTDYQIVSDQLTR